MRQRTLIRLLTVALLATTPATVTVAELPGIVNIDNDRGGNVLEAIQRRNMLQRTAKLVRIRGYCRSACTIYLSLPNACLGARAVLGFHAPRIPGTSIIPPLVGDLMGQFYRGEVKRRWYGSWQYSLDMHKITAVEYKKLDPQIRICGTADMRRG